MRLLRAHTRAAARPVGLSLKLNAPPPPHTHTYHSGCTPHTAAMGVGSFLRKWTFREPVLAWTAYWSIAGETALDLLLQCRGPV
jgi:hypothetical protein